MAQTKLDLPIRRVAVLTAVVDPTRRALHLLRYHRIRCLLERVTVRDKATGEPIQYRTEFCDARAPGGAESLFETLMTSDLVIAVVDVETQSLLYEFGVRAALRGECFLLVDGSLAPSALPPMLASSGFLHAEAESAEKVLAWIDERARTSVKTLGPRSAPPPELVQLIEEHDHALKRELQEALERVERYDAPLALVTEHARYLSPRLTGRALNAWQTFYPYSLWRIRWSSKRHGTASASGRMIGEPTLIGGNQLFAALFTMVNFPQFPPDPNGPDALTLRAAVDALRPYFDDSAFKPFVDDQAALAQTILVDGEFTEARKPIVLTDEHPDPDFRGKSILPHVFGRWVVGDEAMPHATYLLIVYMEA